MRFYFPILLIMLLAGIGGAAAFERLVPKRFEAVTLVLNSGARIGPRQLGSVSQALFQTAAVSGPAIEDLGVDASPRRFFADHVELRPIPDTNALEVIGRAPTEAEAKDISAAVARSFVRALNIEAGVANFSQFSGPERAALSDRPTRTVAITLGAASGVWIGLGLALFHYRFRRPVLTLGEALDLARPDAATIVGGRFRWLGVLRPRLRFKDTSANRARLARLAQAAPRAVEAAGARRRVARRIVTRLSSATRHPSPVLGHPEMGVLVAGTGTRAEDLGTARLALSTAREGVEIALVWVR